MARNLSFTFLINDRASKPLRDIGGEADKTGAKMRGMTRIGAGVARFGVSTSKAVGVAALGIGALGAAAGGMGLKIAADMEQAKISFTTMLGSGEKANKFLKDLQGFAAKTPFEFPELQTAASSLISAGINANKVIPIMTTLGDVTSGMGTGSEGVQRATVALQQMAAAGRITGEDLNQLRDAGIPVYDLLAKATGKSKAEVVKLAQAGKLGEKELGLMMKALESGKGLERFSGLMEKQSGSLTGMWSTMKDTVGMALANIMGSFAPLIKDAMPGIISLSEKVGKKLSGLAEAAGPKLKKAFEFVSTAVSAFVSAVKEGDVTSDGFIGVVETIGDAIHRAWGAFQTALPTIKEWGAKLLEVGKVVGPILLSTLKGVATAIGDVVGWAIQNRDILIPLVAGVVAGTLAWKAYILVTKGFAAVTKALAAMRAAQIALNLAMRANPIGVIITILMALGAAVVVAYKKSATFRAIVDGAWKAIQTAASFAWNNVIKPVVAFLVGAVKGAGERFQTFKDTVSTAMTNIRTAVQDGVRFVVLKFLDFAGGILGAAVTAFGWIPGIGDKLKTAQTEFRKFRDGVNAALGGINDQNVSVNARVGAFYGGGKVDPDDRRKGGRIATGGWIKGPGTGTSDDVPMWTSNGEYVVNAKQARKHAPLIEAINRDRLPHMAKGGPVGFNVNPSTAGTENLRKNSLALIQQWAQKNVQKMLGDVLPAVGTGPFPTGSSGVVQWKGKRYTAAMVARLQLAERIAGTQMYVSQGGFRPTTSYSGTTHNKDAVDVGSPTNLRMQNALRRAGIAAWIRTPDQGPWSRHIHGVPMPGGGVQLARSAYQQTQAYLRGGDGLKGYDRGGILKPGLNLAWNGTGRPEVVPAPGAGRTSGGTTINVTVQGGVYGDKRQAGREIADAIAAFTAGGGKVTVKAV